MCLALVTPIRSSWSSLNICTAAIWQYKKTTTVHLMPASRHHRSDVIRRKAWKDIFRLSVYISDPIKCVCKIHSNKQVFFFLFGIGFCPALTLGTCSWVIGHTSYKSVNSMCPCPEWRPVPGCIPSWRGESGSCWTYGWVDGVLASVCH